MGSVSIFHSDPLYLRKKLCCDSIATTFIHQESNIKRSAVEVQTDLVLLDDIGEENRRLSSSFGLPRGALIEFSCKITLLNQISNQRCSCLYHITPHRPLQ